MNGRLDKVAMTNKLMQLKREDGTYYWLHCRKGKDDVYVDADEMQLDLLGNDPILSKEYIMKAIL